VRGPKIEALRDQGKGVAASLKERLEPLEPKPRAPNMSSLISRAAFDPKRPLPEADLNVGEEWESVLALNPTSPETHVECAPEQARAGKRGLLADFAVGS